MFRAFRPRRVTTMTPARRQYWLVKSEPTTFSFDDLLASPDRTTTWEGVRNFQARNFMRDGMKAGDRVLFYHSSCEPPAVVGIAEVGREAYPDPTQFDPSSDYHDPKSRPRDPTWVMVDLRAVAALPRPVDITELRANPGLEGLELLRRGSRLSVHPVSREHFDAIVRMAK